MFSLKQLPYTSQQESKNISKKHSSHFSEVFMHKSAKLPCAALKNGYEMAFCAIINIIAQKGGKEKERITCFCLY